MVLAGATFALPASAVAGDSAHIRVDQAAGAAVVAAAAAAAGASVAVADADAPGVAGQVSVLDSDHLVALLQQPVDVLVELAVSDFLVKDLFEDSEGSGIVVAPVACEAHRGLPDSEALAQVPERKTPQLSAQLETMQRIEACWKREEEDSSSLGVC